MILGNGAKRACIYFIWDKDGIVDDYVVDQLNDLRNNCAFIHCVINGKVTSAGKAVLNRICDQVYVRENKGNDVGAYKAALEYVGWDELSQYEELVLMNNTCFGPVYPFCEMFQWASKQDVDFWGLTLDTKSNWLGTKNYLHANSSKTHIQSYFLVIRKPLLGSEFLCDFFDDIPSDADYIHSGCLYEYAFPGYFEERGYKGAVYCGEEENVNYPLLHDPVSLLRKYRMPLIKKRSFTHHYSDVLNNTAGEATVRLLRFLKENTSYDLDLIWKSILRTGSLSDIVRCAQLNRVISPTYQQGAPTGMSRIGLVYYAFFEELFSDSVAYIKNFSKIADILVLTTDRNKTEKLRAALNGEIGDYEVRIVENHGRDVSGLLVGAKDFVKAHELVCCAHDKAAKRTGIESVGKSWEYKLHENTMASETYIKNIVTLFEREPRLGIAFPTAPLHGNYAYSVGNGWAGNFHNTKKLLDSLDVNVKINEHTLCVAPLGTCFWFRPKALEKLFAGLNGGGWRYSDFPRELNRYDQTIVHAIARAYAYVAQDAGYYPVYLYNSEYAEIELTNLEFNKTGSMEMRGWVEALAMNAIGYSKTEEHCGNTYESAAVLKYCDQNVNYGVKRSLVHLAFALRCKYPRLWSAVLPIRRLAQKILRIETR